MRTKFSVHTAIRFIQSRIKPGTIVNADESPAWNALHGRFEMKRINHQEAYSLDGACTNWAEEFFSRMRRAEIGHHHHIAGAYLLRYAQEASWREDNGAFRIRALRVTHGYHHASHHCGPRSATWRRRLVRPWTLVR
jgi:ISXO2-like transposase domain